MLRSASISKSRWCWLCLFSGLTATVRLRFINPEATLQELFRRIVVNVILGNTDDHARNHAAFWNGSHLELTPAYDICPQPRSIGEAFLAMAYGPDGERRARLAACVHAANIYGYTRAQAADLIEQCVTTVTLKHPENAYTHPLEGGYEALS